MVLPFFGPKIGEDHKEKNKKNVFAIKVVEFQSKKKQVKTKKRSSL